MFSYWYSLYAFVIAVIISILEIQIEGKNGWAKNLPCWRPKQKRLPVKIISLFQGGKEVTGYHLALNLLEVAIFHFPFFAGADWNIARQMQILSCLPLFWILQDFTWFVWNPFYGLKRFNARSIPWHKKWAGPVPADYLVGILFSVIFAYGTMIFKGFPALKWWGVSALILAGAAAISCFASIVLQKIKSRN